MDTIVDNMTTRLTAIADGAEKDADMVVNMDKTFSQHVFRREEIKVTATEVREAEKEHAHQCDFCERRFKTQRGMYIHRANCIHNYDATEEAFPVEDILDVFGFATSRWFLVKYQGHEKPEWNREHLLKRDGCHDAIRSYWAKSGRNPSKHFYNDPNGKFRCTVCNKTFSRNQDLKAHRTRSGHHEKKNDIVTKTAVKDAVLQKRKEMQKKLPRVKWGEVEAKNSWLFKYLGSLFEAGGAHMPDVKARIAMASQRFGKLRHIWTDNELHFNLRMRLYKACVCSILTYGSEAWRLTKKVSAALNGANARMVSVITDRTVHQEASPKTHTFDLVRWIRARRLQWVGHILRLGRDRKIKQAMYEMFTAPQPGDLLMDIPKCNSWRMLCTYACDREYWRERVRAMRKQPRIVMLGPEFEEGGWAPFTISSS